MIVLKFNCKVVVRIITTSSTAFVLRFLLFNLILNSSFQLCATQMQTNASVVKSVRKGHSATALEVIHILEENVKVCSECRFLDSAVRMIAGFIGFFL